MYEKILWFLAGWTLFEGGLVGCCPSGAIVLTKKLLPSWGSFLENIPLPELRKLGAIEFGFGLLLGAYMFWAA